MLPALINGIARIPSHRKIKRTRPSTELRPSLRAVSKSLSGELQDALGMLFVGIDAGFHRVHDRLVDHQLAVVADVDLESIHRARRRTFEVHSADVIARAVARALEFLLRLEPPRRASEMRALGEDRVEARLGADDPGAEILLVFFADFADHVVIREAGLEFRRWQKEHARKRRSHRREQTDQRERTEAGPSEHAEKIAGSTRCPARTFPCRAWPV